MKKICGVTIFLLAGYLNIMAQSPALDYDYARPKFSQELSKRFYIKTYDKTFDTAGLPQLKVILWDDSELVNHVAAHKYKVCLERKKLIFGGTNCLITDSIYSFHWVEMDKKDSANTKLF